MAGASRNASAAAGRAEASTLFPGFTRVPLDVTINAIRAGQGSPVLLLHGWPQTHVMWHKIAADLATRFTVVAADLRGYGDSSKPRGGGDHATYSKRAMAQDQVALMEKLGFRTFAVVGHDRGARVAHRMALDHPDRIARLAVLDVAPTLAVYETAGHHLTAKYWHWFMLSGPAPLPERMLKAEFDFAIGGVFKDPRLAAPGTFTPDAISEYLRCMRDDAAIHATCEDYRAGASIDLIHDRADLTRKVTCPVLALWGTKGNLEGAFDRRELDVWRARATNVTGQTIPAGHFLVEENPAETLKALLAFL